MGRGINEFKGSLTGEKDEEPATVKADLAPAERADRGTAEGRS